MSATRLRGTLSKLRVRGKHLVALAALLVLGIPSLATSAPRTWRGFLGTGGGTWSTPAHWLEGVEPVSSDEVTFDLVGANSVSLSSGEAAGRLVVDFDVEALLSGGGLVISGGSPNEVFVDSSGTLVIDTTLTLAANPSRIAPRGQAVLRGTLLGSSGLQKRDTGVLDLEANAFAFSGPIDVLEGLLRIRNGNSVPDASTIFVAGPADLEVVDSERIGGLADDRLFGTGGGDVILSDDLFVGHNNADTTFSGTLSGTHGLNKVGTGSLTLTGSGTYSGATVIEQGTLIVTAGATGGGSVSIYEGATLAGTGNLGTAVQVLGTLSPGDDPMMGSLGVLSANYISFGANSTTVIEIEGDTPGTEHDQLSAVVIAPAGHLSVGTPALAPGASADVVSATSLSGTFDTTDLDLQEYTIEYLIDADGGSKDVVRIRRNPVPVPIGPLAPIGIGIGILFTGWRATRRANARPA